MAVVPGKPTVQLVLEDLSLVSLPRKHTMDLPFRLLAFHHKSYQMVHCAYMDISASQVFAALN